MDPINPIAENSESLGNQNPEQQKMPSADRYSSITIVSMAIFVLMSLAVVGFLYFQNQQLKSMLNNYQQVQYSPTPVATIQQTSSPSASPKLSKTSTPSATLKACTMEVKICPDGSSVGRSGPNCEFALCPTP